MLAKKNVKALWLQAMIQERDDIVALDSAIILHPRVWEASGHLAGFSDPLVDCRTCKLRFRADHLDDAEHEEIRCGKRPSKRPGETPDCDLTEARNFNLMLSTTIGPVEETGSTAYLRPETAQGIFVNFKNVLQIARRKPPFGIAQIGKSFRNEITPGNFLFRTREFEQMEMEFFVPPAEADEWYRYWVEERYRWYVALRHPRGEPARPPARRRRAVALLERHERHRVPVPDRLVGARGDREPRRLRPHARTPSTPGKPLEYVDQDGERYVPHVVEPAAGADRALLAFLVDAYDEEVVGERDRTVLRFHPRIAPVKAAVLPLIGRDEGMVGKARGLYEELRTAHMVEYDDNGAIGRRYRRQDEIGTPWAFTIDEQTLEDDTVTVRDRDSLAQERIPLGGVVRRGSPSALARALVAARALARLTLVEPQRVVEVGHAPPVARARRARRGSAPSSRACASSRRSARARRAGT